MRRRRTWALAMCLAVAYVAALASVAMAQEPPGHVTGLVRDAVNSGTLLDGVLVEALSGTNVVASTSTHSDGFYELPLAVGTYELRFSLADYPTIIIDEVRVVAGQTTVLNVGLTTSPAVFHVSLSLDGIGGEGWLPETKVTITADDPGTLQYPDIERSLTTDAMGVLEGSKMFSAKPGWVFTVTDGVQTKTHVVRDVVITSVDPVTDIVRGTADRSDPLYVTDTVLCNPMAAQGINDQVYYPVPEANGYWQANFSAPYDITPGSEVDVLEIDEDADSTFVLWKVPAGRLAARFGESPRLLLLRPTLVMDCCRSARRLLSWSPCDHHRSGRTAMARCDVRDGVLYWPQTHGRREPMGLGQQRAGDLHGLAVRRAHRLPERELRDHL